jgi:hypothetical protein
MDLKMPYAIPIALPAPALVATPAIRQPGGWLPQSPTLDPLVMAVSIWQDGHVPEQGYFRLYSMTMMQIYRTKETQK